MNSNFNLKRKPGNKQAQRPPETTSRHTWGGEHHSETQTLLGLQQTAGNQAVNNLLEGNLQIGTPGDGYEKQAGHIADRFFRPHHPQPASASQASRAIPTSTAPQTEAPPNQFAQKLERQRGQGNALPGALRREMEAKLGADFSDVRLHFNQEAIQLNRQISARAFTSGKDIFLNSGQYHPYTSESKRLLAHELTHVVQQTGKRTPATSRSNGRSAPSLPAPTPGQAVAPQANLVQREPDDDLPGKKSNYGQYVPFESSAASGYGQYSQAAAPASGSGYGQYSQVAAAPASGSGYGQYSQVAAAPVVDSGYGQFVPNNPAAQASKPKPAETSIKPSQFKGKFNPAALDGKDSMAVKLTAAAQQAHPAPIQLHERFKDENIKVGWRAFQDQKPGETAEQTARRNQRAEMRDVVTRHYSDTDREANKLTTQTTAKQLYAMSPEGQAVLGSGPGAEIRGGVRTNLHHSSIFSGGAVTHAGHIGAAGGKVNYLDDDSGHYRPDATHTWDAYNRLKSQGQLAASGTVSMVDKGQVKGVSKNYGANTLALPFSSYEQTHGNEEQARRKKAMLAELMAGRQ